MGVSAEGAGEAVESTGLSCYQPLTPELPSLIQNKEQFPHHLPQLWPHPWIVNGRTSASCDVISWPELPPPISSSMAGLAVVGVRDWEDMGFAWVAPSLPSPRQPLVHESVATLNRLASNPDALGRPVAMRLAHPRRNHSGLEPSLWSRRSTPQRAAPVSLPRPPRGILQRFPLGIPGGRAHPMGGWAHQPGEAPDLDLGDPGQGHCGLTPHVGAFLGVSFFPSTLQDFSPYDIMSEAGLTMLR
jgi:hypothetical protein